MRTTLFLSLAVSFGLLLGCNNSNQASEATNKINQSVKMSRSLDTQLSGIEEKNSQTLLNYIQETNQLTNELDLLLVEFQRNDELHEAIDMMKTARDEANNILNEVKLIKVENNSVDNLKIEYEVDLLEYVTGLDLQIAGMENLDVKKLQEGYQLTKKAKNEIKHYSKKIKNESFLTY